MSASTDPEPPVPEPAEGPAEGSAEGPAEGPTGRIPGRIIAALALVGVALLAIGLGIGWLATPHTSSPSTYSAEAGFARDMQIHHAQAVELATIARDQSSDPEIRLLALDTMMTQQSQIGQMYGWLDAWGLPQASPEPSMTWMTRPTLEGGGHEDMATDEPSMTPGGPMPGMATDDQIAHLKTLSGTESDIEYLNLMIAHHTGGVAMAEALLARSNDPMVTRFAQSIVTYQTSEIANMEAMLAART